MNFVYAAFNVASLSVILTSAAEIYLISTKKDGNIHRLSLSGNENTLSINPVSPEDPTRPEAEQIYNIFKPYEELSQKDLFQIPTYGNHKTVTKKEKFRLEKNKTLLQYLKYLLNGSKKSTFQDLTRLSPFSEDYVNVGEISRIQSFSHDYIDFGDLRKDNRNNRTTKQALRSIRDSDDSDDNSSDDFKSKRFEVIKNVKKKIYSDSDAAETAKNAFEKSDNEELDSDEDFSELSDKERSKTKKQSKKKPSILNEESDVENVEMYLQGNKLSVFPPKNADSDESNDDTRRKKRGNRRMRMPYFLPKRYHWSRHEIPRLGYFFFDGPKGMSQESD